MLILLKSLEFRQMLRHFRVRKPLTIPTVIAHAECQKMVLHNATDIQRVMEIFQQLIVKEFYVSCFAWYMKYQVFNPCEVGRQTHNPAVVFHMSANLIGSLYHIFKQKSNLFSKVWSNSQRRCLHPKPKGLGFDTEI